MSTSTPWGIADYIQPCVRGVALVQTPSHGGIRVSKGLAERELSNSCRAAGEQMYGYYFFEEDCACALPFFEHPEWFKNIYHDNETVNIFKDKAKIIIERWFPEYFK